MLSKRNILSCFCYCFAMSISSCHAVSTDNGLSVELKNFYYQGEIYHALKMENVSGEVFRGNVTIESMRCILSDGGIGSSLNGFQFDTESIRRIDAASTIVAGNEVSNMVLNSGEWFLMRLNTVRSRVDECEVGISIYADEKLNRDKIKLKPAFLEGRDIDRKSDFDVESSFLKISPGLSREYTHLIVMHEISGQNPGSVVVAEDSFDGEGCEKVKNQNAKYLLNGLDFDAATLREGYSLFKGQVFNVEEWVKNCSVNTVFKYYSPKGKYLGERKVSYDFKSLEEAGAISVFHQNLFSDYIYLNE